MLHFSCCLLIALTAPLVGMPNGKKENTDDIFRRGFSGLLQGDPREDSPQSMPTEREVLRAMSVYRDNKVYGFHAKVG